MTATATTAPAPTGYIINRYAGDCAACGKRVGAGEGLAKRTADGWKVGHRTRTACTEAPEATPRREITEGFWFILTGETITVYKVQHAHHGSGRLYAKILDGGTFDYAPEGMRDLRASGQKMDMDTARKFGHLYGMCCRCGRILTDENSIAAGIGPKCASKGF